MATMTFDEMIAHFCFETNDGGHLYYRQISAVSWVVIEVSYSLDNMEIVYDFYKIKASSNKRNGGRQIKYYETKVCELFLVSRVVKYFEFLADLKRKKKLEPFGGSEHKYREHLKKQALKEKKIELEKTRMKDTNLILHDGKSRRKRCAGQMKMDLK